MGRIILGDNLEILPGLASEDYELIYIDPPFNTGKRQRLDRIRTEQDEDGDRVGFGGRRYRTVPVSTASFADRFVDFLGFLGPRLEQAHRLLAPTGSFFLHVDPRESHYCKVALDELFGRDCFINEIIWAYDFGGRTRKRWPPKHDTILWYAKDPKDYTFRYDRMERIPYMAPGLVGAEKASRGKTPTDVWWHTIVPTRGAERTGYPTQKPLGVLKRIVEVHTQPGDHVLDFFAGSGTTGEAAARAGCDFTLVDVAEEAVQTMARRLAFAAPECVGFTPEAT